MTVKGVEGNFILSQQSVRLCVGLIEAGSEMVVQMLGAVDAQADVEAVFLEELAPGFVQQHAVGLEIVLDAVPFGVLSVRVRTTLRKKSRPNSAGSPPCQLKTTGSSSWPAMYWRMNFSSRSSVMRS